MNQYSHAAENKWRAYQNELNEHSNSDEMYVYKISVRLAHMYPNIDQNELYDNLLKIHKEIGGYNWTSEVSTNNHSNMNIHTNSGYNGNNNRSVNSVNSVNNRNIYPGNENQSVGGRRKRTRKAKKSRRKSRTHRT